MRIRRGLTIRNMCSVEKCRTYGARLLFARNPALPGWAEVWSRPYGPLECRTPNRTRKGLTDAKSLTLDRSDFLSSLRDGFRKGPQHVVLTQTLKARLIFSLLNDP